MRYVVPSLLILLAALSRLIPHAPNVAPITAIALFSAVYLDRKQAFLIPVASLLISDFFIGFYSGMAWVYGSFIAIAAIGLWLRKHPGIVTTAGASLAGSVLFYAVTNFGVWLSSQLTYAHTLQGLAACYIAAIPFFRNTILGDAGYVAVMFGSFEILRRYIPALRAAPDAERA
jgi:hypothetical protein